MNTEPITGTFHDAATGQTVVRELTTEELVEYEATIANAEHLPSPE
jgi:hypothetical protein